MEQSVETIEKLLDRWLEGLTTEAEERVLREFFRRGDVPASLRYAQAMFGGLDALAAETAAPLSAVPGKRPLKHRVMWIVPVAAAIAVGVFLLAGYLRQPYCYINGVAVYDVDKAMAATICFDRLEEFDRPVVILDELINQNK